MLVTSIFSLSHTVFYPTADKFHYLCQFIPNALTLYHTITTFKKPFENYQYFLLFPQCFLPFPNQFSVFQSIILSSSNTFNLDQSKIFLFGKEFIWTSLHFCSVVMSSPFPKQALVFACLHYTSFENTVGKGETAHNEHISPFPAVFSNLSENFLPFSSNLKLSSPSSLSLAESKICCLGKG